MHRTPVLMSAENPDGWKLEELLAVLQQEIHAKTKKVWDDNREPAATLIQNNMRIQQLLGMAEGLQRDSLAALDKVAPYPGPTGTPRVGPGSPGYAAVETRSWEHDHWANLRPTTGSQVEVNWYDPEIRRDYEDIHD